MKKVFAPVNSLIKYRTRLYASDVKIFFHCYYRHVYTTNVVFVSSFYVEVPMEIIKIEYFLVIQIYNAFNGRLK